MLKRLDQDQIESILTRGLQQWRGEDTQVDATKDKEALKQLAVYSDGDGKHLVLRVGKQDDSHIE